MMAVYIFSFIFFHYRTSFLVSVWLLFWIAKIIKKSQKRGHRVASLSTFTLLALTQANTSHTSF